MDAKVSVSTKSWQWEKKNSISAGTRTCDLFKWVQCSNQWDIPAPWDFICPKRSCLDHCNSLLPGCPQYLFTNYKKSQTTLLTFSWEFPKLTISLILLLSIGCPLMHGYSTNLLPCATIASAGPPLSTWLNSWKVSNQPTSNALLLIFPFFVFPLWACTHLARDYLTLHHLCGAVSLCCVRSSNTLTSFKPSLKSHLFKLSYCLWVCVHMFMCVCARICQRTCGNLFWLCFGSLLCYGLSVPVGRNST